MGIERDGADQEVQPTITTSARKNARRRVERELVIHDMGEHYSRLLERNVVCFFNDAGTVPCVRLPASSGIRTSTHRKRQTETVPIKWAAIRDQIDDILPPCDGQEESKSPTLEAAASRFWPMPPSDDTPAVRSGAASPRSSVLLSIREKSVSPMPSLALREDDNVSSFGFCRSSTPMSSIYHDRATSKHDFADEDQAPYHHDPETSTETLEGLHNSVDSNTTAGSLSDILSLPGSRSVGRYSGLLRLSDRKSPCKAQNTANETLSSKGQCLTLDSGNSMEVLSQSDALSPIIYRSVSPHSASATASMLLGSEIANGLDDSALYSDVSDDERPLAPPSRTRPCTGPRYDSSSYDCHAADESDATTEWSYQGSEGDILDCSSD